MKQIIRNEDGSITNLITAKYIVTVEAEFDETESDEMTVAYLLDQDLSDSGWSAEIELIDED